MTELLPRLHPYEGRHRGRTAARQLGQDPDADRACLAARRLIEERINVMRRDESR